MLQKQDLLVKLGHRIAQLRKQAGLTQEELAYRCNKDQQVIHRLEKGGRNVSIYFLYEIANGLGVTVKEIIEF